MPTYEYACATCGHQWEEIQKISEAPIEVCPKCQESSARRQISGGNFILKGGGWYADLYSSSKPSKKDDSGSGSSGSSSSGSSGSTSGGSDSGGSSGGSKSESSGGTKAA